MSEEVQNVVVIQDASREVSWSAIGKVLQGLPLKSGDKLTLLGILHQVNNPSTLSLIGARKILGYKSKVDANSMFGANQKIVNEEIARKKEEYYNNVEIMTISKKCETEKIEFHVVVRAGVPSPKMVALKAAKLFKATWVILDRQMKKDKKYFLERLSCRISRMKRDNTIEQLRGPKSIGNTKMPSKRRSTSVTYDEMIPGSDEEEVSPKKSSAPQKAISGKEQEVSDGGDDPPWNSTAQSTFSKSSSNEKLVLTATVSSSSLANTYASSSSLTEATKYSPSQYHEEDYTTFTEHETAGEQSPLSMAENQEESPNKVYMTGSPEEQQNSDNEWMGGYKPNERFENSVCSHCRNRRPRIGWKRDFTYAELQAATENFAPKNFLSEGGFGSVYRGELKNGMKIAVKQHKNASFQGEKEFKSEVNVLSKARHENLVMLLGSCAEGSQRLLVYEYVCDGSLDLHLSKHSRKILSWEKRVKIALGAAQGLKYLHENNIVHRDMRPNNILVTHDRETLLGDFGLARTQQEDSDHSSDTRVVGSFGYLAPEYAESGKVSTKTDVYSFGVVLLQLITGLRTTEKTLGGKSLVGWARPLLKERNYPDLIDQRIIDSHDVHQLFWMVRVAEKCLSKDPQKRLTMEKVVSALEQIIKGSTICGITDFSPTQSDYGSVPNSSDSHENDDTTEQESFSTDITSSFSSKSQISSLRTPSPTTHTVSAKRFYTSTSSGQHLSSGKDHEKKREFTRSRNNLQYDEMIN